MSVLQIPIPVARTLFAPIMTARTAALVNRGSLEMGRLVKVGTILAFFLGHVFSEGVLLFFDQRVLKRFLSISLSFRIDIDDSSADTNPFDVRG